MYTSLLIFISAQQTLIWENGEKPYSVVPTKGVIVYNLMFAIKVPVLITLANKLLLLLLSEFNSGALKCSGGVVGHPVG